MICYIEGKDFVLNTKLSCTHCVPRILPSCSPSVDDTSRQLLVWEGVIWALLKPLCDRGILLMGVPIMPIDKTGSWKLT